jgi:hypothetical protein
LRYYLQTYGVAEQTMKVRGILVEGADGKTYLIGIGPRAEGIQPERPTIWHVAGATFKSLEETRSASATIRDHFALQTELGPNPTHDEYVKQAALESLAEFIKKFFKGVRW